MLEYVADNEQLGAKTLFATHYHELTELEDRLDGVKNYNIAVKKRGDDITFLRRIVPGGADDSYGIEVAKLAGVPDQRGAPGQSGAQERSRPAGAHAPGPCRHGAPQEEAGQLSLRAVAGHRRWCERLRKHVDANTLTPHRGAARLLYDTVPGSRQRRRLSLWQKIARAGAIR